MAKRDFFEIDKNNLDEEWVDQPLLYRKYARLLAKASKQLELARAALAAAKAEASKRMRRNPVKYGYTKATEEVVKTGFCLVPIYKKAEKGFIAAKYKYEMLQAAVKTLDHRKSALERLVHLHGQNYFSKPNPLKGDYEKITEAKKSIARTKGRSKRKGRKK